MARLLFCVQALGSVQTSNFRVSVPRLTCKFAGHTPARVLLGGFVLPRYPSDAALANTLMVCQRGSQLPLKISTFNSKSSKAMVSKEASTTLYTEFHKIIDFPVEGTQACLSPCKGPATRRRKAPLIAFVLAGFLVLWTASSTRRRNCNGTSC